MLPPLAQCDNRCPEIPTSDNRSVRDGDSDRVGIAAGWSARLTAWDAAVDRLRLSAAITRAGNSRCGSTNAVAPHVRVVAVGVERVVEQIGAAGHLAKRERRARALALIGASSPAGAICAGY